MKKIEIAKEVLDIKGKPIKKTDTENWKLKDYLPEVLLAYKQEGSMKKFLLAQRIATCESETVELDEADFSILKNAVKDASIFPESTAGYNTLFNGQILIYLEGLKD